MSNAFVPIRGTEETIRNLNIENGHIYFASDTGHVYMDKDAETRIAISGRGSSVFLFDYTEPITNFLGLYIFPVNKLTYAEPNFYSDTIKDDDIIINIASGELFRVLYVKVEKGILSAFADKITLAGTGSGGSPDTPSINTISLELLSSIPYRFVYGREAYASFVSTAIGSSDINIRLTVIGADGSTHERTKMVQSGEEFDIEFGTLLFLGDNTILVSANGDNLVNSGTIEKRYRQRQATNLELRRPDTNSIYTYLSGDSIAFSYIPIGAVEKEIELLIDDNVVYTELIPSNVSNAVRNITITRDMLMLGDIDDEEISISGYHEILLRLTASDEDGNNTIEAEPLRYELAWVDDTTTAPIIWFPNGTPSTVSQYTTVNIEYMVFDPSTPKGISVLLFTGDNQEGVNLTLDYNPGTPHIWTLSELAVGTNDFRIKCGNTERQFLIECIALSERDLDIIKDGLILNLDAAGRSNTEDIANRLSWPRGNTTNQIQFINFNWYNNGWITDADTGLTCLRISNGAKILIPFTKLNSELLAKSLALEFRFKIRNVKEYTTLTTRGVIDNGSEETEEETVLTLETENSVCGRFWKREGGQKGLLIGTQEAVFSYGPTLSVRYKEDEIIDLMLVFDADALLIYMYLNGILSSALHYNNFANLCTKAEEIEFNSDYCDVDLYSIRVYETDTVFSIENVIHNYIATLSGEERLNTYDTNQIISYNYETKEPYIDYYKMVAYNTEHPDTPLMPYAIVKSKTADDLLPYRKGDEKGCVVDFVNPYLDYLWEHRYDVDTSKHPVIDAEKYMKSCPSFHYDSGTKANFNVQGTSSQGYPRRNFKLKTKGCSEWYYTNGPAAARKDEEGHVIDDDLLQIMDGVTVSGTQYKKWYMDSDLPADKFCWKADYMESSGSYNTGFANFANILYENHPLYNIFHENQYNTYRTSVYGFPMLVFQEKQERAEDGKAQYEFVGKYNFNLDKSSNTRYGFELEINNPYVNKPIKKIAECWEFTNNQGTYCAFRTPWPEESLPDNFDELSAENKEAAIQRCSFKPIADDSFEYRYNADEDALDSMTFINGISIANINPVVHEKGDPNKPTRTVRSFFTNFKVLYEWLYNIGQITDEQLRIAAFKADFNKHLNKEYCFIYFILTELLHCYDSRGKNMMLATWGPETEGGDYIWYPIFYDIDTQLGLNNSGEQLWDYYAEPTDNDDFSTSNSVLWNCLWEAYSTEIKEKYNSIRTADKVSYENVDGYYNFNPVYTRSLAMKGLRPLAVYNIDEYYKYIAPSLTGFIDTSGNLANDSWGHLYCLQGTRKLSRALYLRNRINYLDSKWLGGAYAYTAVNGGGFETRLNANYLGKTSDEYIVGTNEGYILLTDAEWPNALDANPAFTVRPFLKQYVSVYYDRTPTIPTPSNNIVNDRVIFNKISKEYFLTSDHEFDPAKTYYIIDVGIYTKLTPEYIETHDGSEYFVAANLDDVTNLNYNKYYIQTINDETGAILYVSAAGTEYDHSGNTTYYYWNVWERSYRVTPDNYTDFYIKNYDGITFSLPNRNTTPYDDNQTYYELVELIPSEPTAATGSGLVSIIPDNDIIHAYKTTPNHTLQLAYVTGAEYISDLGDLSNKYFNQFNIGGAYRLEHLVLGSDAELNGKVYKNEVLKNILLATAKTDLHPKTLLKEVVLNGLTNFNSFLDLSGCEKLETFRALRTALPLVAFADGVLLKTLHLPNTINTLSLVNANHLTHITDLALDENKQPVEGLYIEGFTNVAEPTSTNIIKISLENDALGYDGYRFLNKLVHTKIAMKNDVNNTLDADLAIGMRKISWSPYTAVPYGTPVPEENDDITYYFDTGRFTIEPLAGARLNTVKRYWSQYLSNGMIFTKTDLDYTTNNYPIQDLSLLEIFRNDYDSAILKSDAQFSDDNPYKDVKSVPEITGVLYVYNNDPNNTTAYNIKETDLIEYRKYFPNLRIFCEHVIPGTKITYMHYKENIPESIDDNNIIEYTNLARFENDSIILNATSPFATVREEHYLFNGWRLFDAETLTIGDFVSDALGIPINSEELIIDNGTEYTVIADFSKQKYNITFFYERAADGTPTTSFTQLLEYKDVIPFPAITEHYPWLDDNTDDLYYNETYQFIGYAKNNPDSSVNFTATQSTLPIAVGNVEYYAVFKKVKVDRNILSDVFFIYDEEADKFYLNPIYKDILKGKITIPTKIKAHPTDKQKRNYSSFGSGIRGTHRTDAGGNLDYYDSNAFKKITHVFWASDKNNTKFTTINDYCFEDWLNLRYIELPDSDSVTTLGKSAFSSMLRDAPGLFNNYGKVFGLTADLTTQYALNKFFANITSIGSECFKTNYTIGDAHRWQNCLIYFNPNLSYLGQAVFFYNKICDTSSYDNNSNLGFVFGNEETPMNSTFIKWVANLMENTGTLPVLTRGSSFENDRIVVHRIYYGQDIDDATLSAFINHLGNVHHKEALIANHGIMV